MTNRSFAKQTDNSLPSCLPAFRKRVAFTLAEVFIILGIIGIVAAMTLPVLIQSYKKQVVETRLKRFYTTMNQAVKLAENEYGDWHNWEFLDQSETLYNKYLKNYLTGVKVERTNSTTRYYLSDGSGFYPVFNYINDSTRWGHAEMFYCPFGVSRCDVSGKNRFSFVFNTRVGANKLTTLKNPVEPYAFNWNRDISMLRNHDTYGCRLDAQGTNTYCTMLIMINGWKIPDDYPHRF